MRAATAVLYARVPEDLLEWVRQLAEESGLSMAQVTAALIADCRGRGITAVAVQLRAIRPLAPPLGGTSRANTGLA